MLNNFHRYLNNSLDTTENRLTHFSLEDHADSFFGRENIEQNYEGGEVSEALLSILENLGQLDSGEVDAGRNMYHTLIELFGEEAIAAEIADGLEDDLSEGGFNSVFEDDANNVLYATRTILDSVRYDSSTTTLELVKDDNVLFSANLETLRSNLYLEFGPERGIEEAEVAGGTAEELAALSAEIQDADPDTIGELREEAELLEARGETEMAATVGETTATVPPERVQAEIEAAEARESAVEGIERNNYRVRLGDRLSTLRENPYIHTNFDLPEEMQEVYSYNEFRQLLVQERVTNSDLIASHLRTLNLNLDEFVSIINSFSNITRGRNIDGSLFLSRSQFSNYVNSPESIETYEMAYPQFIERLSELLSRADNLSEEEAEELQAMATAFEAVSNLIGILTTMELQEAQNVSPDYVTDVELSDDIKDALDLRGGEVRGGKDEFGVFAIYTYLYGPIDNIVEQPGIRVEEDNDGDHIIHIDSLPTDHIELLRSLIDEFDDIERLNIGVRGRRTLTRALEKIRTDDDFAELRRAIYTRRLSEAIYSGERNQEAILVAHLQAIFDVTDTGPAYRQRRHAMTLWEVEENREQGEGEEYADARSSQASRYTWLLTEPGISNFENGQRVYNIERFAQRLQELFEGGKDAIFLNRDFTPERRAELAQVQARFTPEVLMSSERMPEDVMLLIRYGALNGMIVEQSRNEHLEESPARTPAYDQIRSELIRNNVEEEDIPELITKAEDYLIGLTMNENGVLDGLEAGVAHQIQLDRAGRVTLTTQAGANTSGEVVFGMTLRAEIIQGERANLYASAFAGIRNELLNPIDGSIPGFTLSIGSEIDLGNGWFFHPRVGAVAGLVPFQTLEYGLTTDRLVERAMEEDGEMGELDPETLRSLTTETPTDLEVIQILSQLGNEHPINAIMTRLESEGLSQRERFDLARTYLRMFAIEKSNAAIREATGVGFSAGATVYETIIPPSVIVVPFIRISWLGQVRTFYSLDDRVENTESAMSQRIIAAQIANEQQAANPEESFIITTTNGHISYDGETGAREVSEGAVFNSGEVLDGTSTADVLNSKESVHGMHFVEQEGYAAAFSLDDFNDQITSSGIGTNVELLVDPASGVTIEQIGPNLFGVIFGGSPDNLIPEGFAITRQEIIYPLGEDNTREVSITFSNRITSARMLRGNPETDRYRINESGNVISDRNFIDDRQTREYQYLSSQSGFDSSRWDINYPETSSMLDYGYSPEEREEAIAATRDLFSIVGSDGLSETYSPRIEVVQFIERLSSNRSQQQEIARLSTITVEDNTEANYRELVDKLNEFAGFSLGDADIQFIIGRAIPGTYRALSSTPEGSRTTEVVRVITDITERFLEDILEIDRYNRRYVNGELVEFTDEEKATIVGYLVDNAARNAESIAENIENLTGVRFGREFEDAELFTTAALQRMGRDAMGFRELLLGQHTDMSYIEGSRVDYQADGELMIVEFIYGLYNPVLPESTENLDTEDVTRILESETGLHLLSLNIGTEEDPISLITKLYGSERSSVITELYRQIDENGSVEQAVEQMSEEDQEIVNHYLETVIEIRSKGVESSETQVFDLDGELAATITLDIAAGSVLVLDCGNLTFFAKEGMTARVVQERETVRAVSDRTTTLLESYDQREERGITASIPFLARPGDGDGAKQQRRGVTRRPTRNSDGSEQTGLAQDQGRASGRYE